jgi:hypothetical protein
MTAHSVVSDLHETVEVQQHPRGVLEHVVSQLADRELVCSLVEDVALAVQVWLSTHGCITVWHSCATPAEMPVC